MLEESVNSSPCSSLRKLRYSRQSKSNDKDEDKATVSPKAKTNGIPMQLYFDEDDNCSQVTTATNWNPFQRFRRGCFSDRLPSKDVNKNAASLKTIGFVPCIKSVEPHVDIDEKTNSEITDSELMNCCQQADEMLLSTPNKGLYLVNSILRDFALSPYTEPAHDNFNFWEHSPEFVLKSKPRITYCSRRHKKLLKVCSKRLHFNDYPGDNCSVSMQDESSQCEDLNTTAIVPEASETLCENLLNLSAYFSQACESNDEETAEQNTEHTRITNNILELMKEIVELRKTNEDFLKLNSSLISIDNFFGFPDRKSDDEDVQKCGVNENNSALFDDWNNDCNDILAAIKTPPHNSPKKYQQTKNLDDRDNDKLLHMGFKTASSKEIYISDEAKNKAASLLTNLPEIVPKTSLKKDIGLNDSEQSNMNDVYDDATSTSKSAMQKHSEYMKRTNELTEDHVYDDVPSTSKSSMQKHSEYIKRNNEQPGAHNIKMTGFQTAGGRCIKPTTKALKSVQNLLQDFQSECEQMEQNDLHPKSAMQKQSEYIKPTNELTVSHNTKMTGFKTAGGRCIKPTAKALKSVEKLLKDFQSEYEHSGQNELLPLKNCKRKLEKPEELGKDPNMFLNDEVDFMDMVFSEWPLEEELTSTKCQNQNKTFIVTETSINEGKLMSPKGKGEIINSSPAKLRNTLQKVESNSFVSEIVKDSSAIFEVAVASKNAAEKYRRRSCVEDHQIKRKLSTELKSPLNKNVKEAFTKEDQISAGRIKNTGFQTASGKGIKPTDKAFKSIEKFLKDFRTDCEQLNENDLEPLKSSQNLHKKSKIEKNHIREGLSKELDVDVDVFGEWPQEEETAFDVSQKHTASTVTVMKPTAKGNMANPKINSAGRIITAKSDKKLSDNCDTNNYCIELKNTENMSNNAMFEEPTTSKDVVGRSDTLQGNRLHNPLESHTSTSSLTELAVKSPLNASFAKTIIARKNLLSMSKKRKRNVLISPVKILPAAEANKEPTSANVTTPNKVDPETPVRLFSTPIGSKSLFSDTKYSTPHRPQDTDDNFQPNSWSQKGYLLSETCSNLTVKSPNPTVNDRIARLRMYGEPPPISPITLNLHTSCRTSGLKRTRSMLKKD